MDEIQDVIGRNSSQLSPMLPSLPSHHSKKRLIIASLVTLILITGLVIFWVYVVHHRMPSVQRKRVDQVQVSDPAMLSAPEAATAESLAKMNVALNAPPAASLTSFQANISAATPDYHQYTTSDGQCSFGFGVRSEQEQTGSSFTEMTALLSNYYLKQRMTILNRSKGVSLVLADASNSSIKYTLPTFVISVQNGSERALQYFSAAILKNGDRISVTRTCQSSAGAVDMTELAAIENIVSQLAIQAQ